MIDVTTGTQQRFVIEGNASHQMHGLYLKDQSSPQQPEVFNIILSLVCEHPDRSSETQGIRLPTVRWLHCWLWMHVTYRGDKMKSHTLLRQAYTFFWCCLHLFKASFLKLCSHFERTKNSHWPFASSDPEQDVWFDVFCCFGTWPRIEFKCNSLVNKCLS